MYQWPASNEETTEQLRRFNTSSKSVQALVDSDVFETISDDRDAEGEEEPVPRVFYSFEDVSVDQRWFFNSNISSSNNCSQEQQQEDDEQDASIDAGHTKKRNPRETSFSLATLSGEPSMLPRSFFLSSEEDNGGVPWGCCLQIANSDSAVVRVVAGGGGAAKNDEEEEDEYAALRRVRSDVEETSKRKELEAEQKQTGASLGNLKKQRRWGHNIRDLLPKKQKAKLEEDRRAQALWGSATSLDKVKKEARSLKGIP